MQKPAYKTIVLSDVHLGTTHSKATELCEFIDSVKCEKLILNGDIIDGWHLQKGGKKGKWRKKHTAFFKSVIQMMDKYDTEVIYVRGNHDDFLDAVVPFNFFNIQIVNYHVHRSFDKEYYVTHGDIFDSITTGARWLARIGDVGYDILLHINKIVNKRRLKRGLPYFSLSQKIKKQVKQAVSYISDYEDQLAKLAKSKKMDGIICGHIHQSANYYIQGVHYLNSGDWVESLTALTEDFDGNWEVYHFDKTKIKEIE